MTPTNREFEMVYSQEEMEQRIEQLKMHGYSESDIHVLARDKDVFNSYKIRSNVDKHEAESFSTKFKSFFSGEDTVHSQLRELDLDQPSVERYSEDIKKGAILLYTDGQSMDRERENTSSFGDDTRTVDIDESNNADRTAVEQPSAQTIAEDSKKIYTSEVRREDQHGHPGYGNKTRDSRLEGDTIHPTTDRKLEDEGFLKEKSFDHEPHLETEAQEDGLNREDGINRRQDESSPGVDPNLGPAPFGRDSEEEQLVRDNDDHDNGNRSGHDDPKHTLDGQDEVDNRHNPRDARPIHEDAEKKTATPPTPRLF